MRGRWLALIAAFVLAGCTDQQSPVQQAQTTHEYRGSAKAPPTSAVSPPTQAAVATIRSFANAYINWDADTVAGQMQMLVSHSVGQARAAMQLAASQTASDYELRRGGIANRGTVEAVAPLIAHADRYVVVTREQTTATNSDAYQGLRPAWHVALASVARAPGGRLVVSRWQPEN
jgi:hypothetical protein